MNKDIKAAEAARKEHLRKAGEYIKNERKAETSEEKELWNKLWDLEVAEAMKLTKRINEMKGKNKELVK